MHARRILAALGLLTYAVLHGINTYQFDAPLRYRMAIYSIGCAIGAIALLRPTFWARRYAIGIGIAGLLNCAAYFGYFRSIGCLWFGAAQLAAFTAIILLLSGKRMRAFYDERAEHWRFDHPTMHVLASALSLNVAGVAMLVYYACMDASWAPDNLRIGALALSVLLSIGSIAAARGRIVGLFLMLASSTAAIWLGWRAIEFVSRPTYAAGYCGEWLTWVEWGKWETVKSVVGFAPAALGSLLCFAVFLGPMVRFVRHRTT